MKVAVTGVSGFVGSALAYALCAEGHDVTAVTRHPERYYGAGRRAGADIRDRDATSERDALRLPVSRCGCTFRR